MNKENKPKKENKQIVEIHIYVHQQPLFQNTPLSNTPPPTITPNGFPPYYVSYC